MNWNHWIRQTHRWLSIAFIAAVATYIAVMMRGPPPAWLGIFPAGALILMLATGSVIVSPTALFFVFAYEPSCVAPRVIVTALGGHRVNAFTGPADHSRQDEQWQYPIAAGFPTTRSSMAPQKQRPLYSVSVFMVSPLSAHASAW